MSHRDVPELAPLDDETDEQLLGKIREGDRSVFGTLVRRYERELYGYLRRYTGDDDLADDVFQNTFVQVFLKIEQYDVSRRARPWLYGIATNQAIDALRKKNRRSERRSDAIVGIDEEGQPRALFDLIASNEVSPPEHADRLEQRAIVRKLVDNLPELLRQVVLLAYFQGMKYRDIAESLEIPVGTVKSRLHAALTKLTELWEAMAVVGAEADAQHPFPKVPN